MSLPRFKFSPENLTCNGRPSYFFDFGIFVSFLDLFYGGLSIKYLKLALLFSESYTISSQSATINSNIDTKEYLKAQIKKILDRVSLFDKLYLEFGGKLCYDHHASRALPGFDMDTKVQMLRRLGDKTELILCVSAKDIQERKIRRDFGLTYDDQALKDMNDLRERGLNVSAVVINRFNHELMVVEGVLALESAGLLKGFFRAKRSDLTRRR